jgi:hypothetical protein
MGHGHVHAKRLHHPSSVIWGMQTENFCCAVFELCMPLYLIKKSNFSSTSFVH